MWRPEKSMVGTARKQITYLLVGLLACPLACLCFILSVLFVFCLTVSLIVCLSVSLLACSFACLIVRLLHARLLVCRLFVYVCGMLLRRRAPACVCVCVYACMCWACWRACVCLRMHVCLCVCARSHVSVCVYARMRVHVRVCVCVHVSTSILRHWLRVLRRGFVRFVGCM